MTQRYTTVATILHWLIAAGIAAMLISGLIINQEWLTEKSAQFTLFQWHKSLGVFILLAIIVRIIWRLTHPAPQLPESLSTAEQRLAKYGHLMLYALLIIMPISGWLMVSSSSTGIPTLVFKLFEWPHLPVPIKEGLNHFAHNGHYYGAIVLSLLLLGHIGAVIKHKLDGHSIMHRMPLTRAAVISLVLASIAISLLSLRSGNVPLTQVVQTGSEQGTITFSGTNSDEPFQGTFTQWSLQTDLNPENGSMTEFNLTIETASATTGSSYEDGTLSGQDWFGVEQYPQATYLASTITKLNDSSYELQGKLTIKDQTHALNIPIAVSDKHTIETQFTLSRLAYNIGLEADPEAEWVSDEIKVTATAKLTE